MITRTRKYFPRVDYRIVIILISSDEILGFDQVEELSKPWLCVRFEFPTNAEMRTRGVAEIIQREPLKTTIIASIDATFTRLFFGEHFVSAVKRLIS